MNFRMDQANFFKLREEQKMNAEFPGFLSLVIKMFNNCQKEPHKYSRV